MTDPDAPVPVDVYVVTVDPETRVYAFKLLETLRKAGVAADADFEGRSVKAQMRSANKMKARFVAVVGPDEARANAVTLRNMADGSEQSVGFADAASKLTGLPTSIG